MTDYQIVKKRNLAKNICEYQIFAPYVAKHCNAGQFVILRTDEDGERVPFTICDYDRDRSIVTILVQEVGFTTKKLSMMKNGDSLCDFVGPLGNKTNLDKYNNICLVGGGIGSAVIFPQAKELKRKGKKVDVILGARSEDLLLYKDEFAKYCDNLYLVTDDGSSGVKGFVTDILLEKIDGGKGYDCVFAVGPLAMMRAVANLTKEKEIDNVVSMNSMMVDGTGMCGCCRVSVGGRTKYACVDGPEFDGHEIDFDEAMSRSRTYAEFEAKERETVCNLFKKVVE